MAHYLKRKLICDRLRLSRRASYDIVGSAYGARISSDEVVAILNRSRRALEPVSFIPTDLLTATELANELVESEITAKDLLNWARRTKNIAPHFRLTAKTILFPRSVFMSWLDQRSKLKSLKVRVA